MIYALPRERRASPENPRVSLTQLGEMFGNETESGVKLTQDVALGYSAVWRGVSLIARAAARIPLFIYQREPDGGRTPARNHSAWKLVRSAPCGECKAFDFKQLLTANAILRGNGYAYIRRNKFDQPVELIPVSPERCYPVRANGKLYYAVEIGRSDKDGAYMPQELRRILPRNMVHIRGLGFDGMSGMDLLTFAKDTLSGGIAARRYTQSYFKRGVSGQLVLEHPASLSEKAAERLRASFEKTYSGLSNAHRAMILEEGLKASTLGVDAQKAQLTELRLHEIREIANLLGVPPHKLGDPERTSYASLEQENQAFLDDSLDPWLSQWEAELNWKLLSDSEKLADSHFFEFQRAALIRTDMKTQAEALTLQVNNGLLTRNEARSILNRPSLGAVGDKLTVPLNHNMLDVADAAPQQDADDLAFKREIVKQFIADGTIGDALFNMIAPRDLLESVGVGTLKDYDAPWLPIVAASGSIVSGEAITGPAGEVVGGDIIRQQMTDVSSGLPQVDSEDPDAVRSAFAKIACLRARRNSHRLISEAALRMLTRIAGRAKSLSGKPDKFMRFAEELATQYDDTRRAFEPGVIATIGDGHVAEIADQFIRATRESLLTLAECVPAELPERVAAWGDQKADLADYFAARAMQHAARRGKTNGTT